MNTIFDCINDVLHTKRGNLLKNIDDESNLNQFMINRWCSMYSDTLTTIINSTVNRLGSIFETKQQYYKFVLSVLPRVSRKRIHYIKKNKEDKKEEIENLDLIAKTLELSQREIKSYYEYSSKQSTSSACSNRSR